jgi:hypothetical protein
MKHFATCTRAFPFCGAGGGYGESCSGATLAKAVRQPTSPIPGAAESA